MNFSHLLADCAEVKRELDLKRSRTAQERKDLAARCSRTLTALLEYFRQWSPHAPCTPEFSIGMGGAVDEAYLRAYEISIRNERVDLLTRAAISVLGDEARDWMRYGRVEGSADTPYYLSLTEEGFISALRQLEKLMRDRRRAAAAGSPNGASLSMPDAGVGAGPP